MTTAIKQQAADLEHNVKDFIRCITSLAEPLFLTPMDGTWTPRDVTAHLVGWNLYTVRGCRQLMHQELPFFLEDPGEDFGKINAELVAKHPATDRNELVALLRTTSEEVFKFILSIEETDWERDWGIAWPAGTPVTLRGSIEPLVRDYADHRKQIEAWAGNTG
jgi:hypothetical protein